MENNQKGVKFYSGPCVYIVRLKKYDNKNMNKFGSSYNFNERFPTYNTSSPDKMYVVDIIPVKNPKEVENAVKNMLAEFVYIKGKEYFHCSYNKILDAVRTVVKFMEDRDVVIESRKTKLSKLNITKKLKRNELSSDDDSDSEDTINSDEDTDIDSSDDESVLGEDFDNNAVENFEIESISQDGGGLSESSNYMEKIYKYMSKIYNMF